MKITRAVSASTLLALSAVTLPALAHDQIYTVFLNGSTESPTNASAGLGVGVVTFDLDLFTMQVQVTFAGLTGNTTASHIHCCTAVAGTANAGVASQTPSFSGFPLATKFGSYDHTFDMTLASSYNAAFITANGNSVTTAFNALLAGADAGKAYLNIHTSAFPGGEIRGFLVPTPVPEPSAYAMMLAGLAAVGWVARKRKQA